jgi:LL-diaminopimelate aminotransferase
VIIERSDRLHHLAPDLTEQFNRIQRRVEVRGVDVVDLTCTTPLLELEEGLGEELIRAAADPEASASVPTRGAPALRRAVARWYEGACGVTLDPDTQVVVLSDARQALLNVALALVGPTDGVCTLDPGDPLHHAVSVMAGCPSRRLPLRPQNGFQPDLDMISPDEAGRLKLMFFGYPHDPTGELAQPDTYPTLVGMAQKHNVILCHDARQSYARYDGAGSVSFLAARGALGVGIEVQEIPPAPVPSPWRLAVVVGNADVLACLVAALTAVAASPASAAQLAAARAIYHEEKRRHSCRTLLSGRRDLLVEGLRSLGLTSPPPDATAFLWLPVPRGYSAARFAALLLRRAGVRVVPGVQFGEGGEGYVRLCFATAEDRLTIAVERLEQLLVERPLLRRQFSAGPGRREPSS